MRNFIARLAIAVGFCLLACALQAQSSSSGNGSAPVAVTPQIQGLTGSGTSSHKSSGIGFLLEDGSFLLQEDSYFFELG